jgi:Flp pilus assembly protein TadD
MHQYILKIHRHRLFRGALFIVLLGPVAVVLGQAPPAIQIFMPDGALPSRSIRFTLTRDDGRIEVLFTDTKGKFQVTGDLIRDADYIVTVETDGTTFDTTIARFRIIRSSPVYTPVFLQPFRSKRRAAPGVIDANLEVNVPVDAREAYQAAMKAVASGQSEEAVTNFKHALSLYPKYLRAMNDLGVLYLQLSRLDEAAALFNQAIRIDKGFAYARLNLGVVFNRKANYREAAHIFESLYGENQSLQGLPLSYADSLIGLGQLSKAEEVLRAALKTGVGETTEVQLHFRLGLILNRLDRFSEAIAELQAAVAMDPTAANAHLLLGGSYLQMNRLPEAEQELLRAYELAGPAVGSAKMFLGQLYLMQQKPEAALRAFEQYLQDVPTAPNEAQIKREIDKLRAALNKK